MPVTIGRITGIGGDPPSHLLVEGTVSSCDALYVTVSCSTEGVLRIDVRRDGAWSLMCRNDHGCGCGDAVTAVASCQDDLSEAVEETLALNCDPPPPECCDSVTVAVETAPLPCVPHDGEISVQCSATVSPEGCSAALEWSVTDLATGDELQPFTSGGRAFSYAYPRAGAYQVAVRVTQDDRCDAHILTDAVELTLAQCASCAGGDVIADCRLDLPKNDVVEAIDFERFFRLDLRFGDLQDAATPDAAAEDAAPGLTNIRSLGLALYLPFRQDWRLCGYCRGRLVNSFSLGPEEEQTVEIYKWDRMTRNLDSTTEFESEDTTESSNTRRDTNDVARDITRQTGFETNSQGKVGFQVGVATFEIGGGFNIRTALNEGEKSTRSAILEATARSTGRVRTSRTLKVVETRESGQETRTTRRLRNANKCNTLTVAFFEILANYLVSTYVRTDAVRLVVLVDSADLIKITGFDRATIRTHERSLRLALLDSTLADGFAAARFLDARDRACAVLCLGCACGTTSGASGAEWTAVTTAANALGGVITTLRGADGMIDAAFRVSVPPLGALAPLPPPVQTPLVTTVKRYLFFKSMRTHAPQLLTQLAGVGLGGGASTVTAAQVEDVARFLALPAPDAVAKLSYDHGVSQGVGAEAYGIFVLSGHEAVIMAPLALTAFWTRVSGSYDDQGLVSAITAFRAAYDTWKTFLQEQRERDEKATAQEKVDKAEREARILENFPLRETADAAERCDALVSHLNESRNLDHYRFAVWNERSGATDDTLISLALAGLIDPTPVGMVGDQLAVPVRMRPGSKAAEFFAASIVDLVEQFVRSDREHILPTPALHAESILGECCACDDFLREHRRLDLADKRAQVDLAEQRAAQARYESERRRLRLGQTPPDLTPLEPADAAAMHVRMESAPTPPAAGGTP